jgi:hypothetical protein
MEDADDELVANPASVSLPYDETIQRSVLDYVVGGGMFVGTLVTFWSEVRVTLASFDAFKNGGFEVLFFLAIALAYLIWIIKMHSVRVSVDPGEVAFEQGGTRRTWPAGMVAELIPCTLFRGKNRQLIVAPEHRARIAEVRKTNGRLKWPALGARGVITVFRDGTAVVLPAENPTALLLCLRKAANLERTQ